MIRRLLDLPGKILAELRRLDRENPCAGLFSESQLTEIETITKIYRQQRSHYESGDAKESIPWPYRKRQQTLRTSYRTRQGDKDGRVRSQVQQHPG